MYLIPTVMINNVHSGHGYGSRNTERERILEFVTAQNMVVVNSFFKKPEQHLITHQSGGHCSQTDYVLLRKKDLKVSKNIKVWRIRTWALALSLWSVIETVTTQRQKCTPKLRIWKLKDQTCKTEFSSEMNEARQTVSLTDSVEESWLNLKRGYLNNKESM